MTYGEKPDEDVSKTVSCILAYLNSGLGGIIMLRKIGNACGELFQKKVDETMKKYNPSSTSFSYDYIFIGNRTDPYRFVFVLANPGKILLKSSYIFLPSNSNVQPQFNCQCFLDIINRTNKFSPPKIQTPFIRGEVNMDVPEENVQVQFKLLQRNNEIGKPIEKCIKDILSRYVSAFANHEGGYILCGIKDDGKAYGQNIGGKEEAILDHIEKGIKNMFWVGMDEKKELAKIIPVKNRDWSVDFMEIKEAEPGYRIVAVKVFRHPSMLVHTAEPTYYLPDDDTGEAKLQSIENYCEALQTLNKINSTGMYVCMHVAVTFSLSTKFEIQQNIANIYKKMQK